MPALLSNRALSAFGHDDFAGLSLGVHQPGSEEGSTPVPTLQEQRTDVQGCCLSSTPSSNISGSTAWVHACVQCIHPRTPQQFCDVMPPRQGSDHWPGEEMFIGAASASRVWKTNGLPPPCSSLFSCSIIGYVSGFDSSQINQVAFNII